MLSQKQANGQRRGKGTGFVSGRVSNHFAAKKLRQISTLANSKEEDLACLLRSGFNRRKDCDSASF
jgi:hypothetical protein